MAVLFVDICDFTALVASSEPEDIKEKIDKCLALMADVIVSYGGAVEKFIGDAVMAVFGVPVTHENDAERAVKAGLDILSKVKQYGAAVGLDIELRAGVHYGEVIAAAVADEGKGIRVFGDTVNVASRLESSGYAGAVTVSQAVYEKTRAFFDYEPLPTIKAKGVPEPLVRFKLVGEKAERGRVRGIQGLTAPMVGRDAELKSLGDAFSAVTQGKGPQVVAITGEPGIGKTRLVEELIKNINAQGGKYTLLAGRCLGYAGERAYYPIVQALKRSMNIKDDADEEVFNEKIKRAVSRMKLDAQTAAEYITVLREFFGLAVAAKLTEADTEQRATKLYNAIGDYLATLSKSGPIILFLEDVHWADAATLDFILHLQKNLKVPNVLIILNARPFIEYGSKTSEFYNKLRAEPNFTELALRDLTAEETADLVASLLEVEGLSAQSRDFIIARSGGNPFFVEEVIKSLIEKGVIIRRDGVWTTARDIIADDVPDSIDGVLRARLDLLPRDEKRVIQRASVVGKVFWERVVTELMEQSVAENLSVLERRDLIRRRLDSIFENDREYIFKHVLLQETAYKSMLRRVRRNLHLKVANWIQKNYGDRLRPYYSLLAYHYEMAGEEEAAAKFYLRAGEYASMLNANEDAEKTFAKAAALSNDPDTVRNAYAGWGDVLALKGANNEALECYDAARLYCVTPLQEAELLYRVGDVYEKMSAYPKALEYFHWAEKLLRDQPVGKTHVWVYNKIAWVHYLKGESRQGMEWAKRAEEMARQVPPGDYDADCARARTYSVLASLNRDLGAPDVSLEYYLKAKEIYETLNNLSGLAGTLNNLSILYWEKGSVGEALINIHKSLEYGRRGGMLFGQAVSFCNLGDFYGQLGAYDEARHYYDEYLKVNALINNRLGDGYAYGGIGSLYKEEGDYPQAIAYLEKSVTIFKELGARREARSFTAELAVTFALAGDIKKANSLIEQLRKDGMSAEGLVLSDAQIMAATLRHVGQRISASRRKKVQTISLGLMEYVRQNKSVWDKLYGSVWLAVLSELTGDVAARAATRATAWAAAKTIEMSLKDDRLRTHFKDRLARVFNLT